MFTLPETATPSRNFINLPAVTEPTYKFIFGKWVDWHEGSDNAEYLVVQPMSRISEFRSHVKTGGGDDIIDGSDEENSLHGER